MIQRNSLTTLLQSQQTAKAVISTDTAALVAISGVGPGYSYVFGRDPIRSYQSFGYGFGNRSGQFFIDFLLHKLIGSMQTEYLKLLGHSINHNRTI